MGKRQQLFEERDSFKRLHKLTYDALFYYAYSRLADKPLCEDLIQESYILLWEKKDDFHDLRAVKSFLFLTVRNKLMTLYRDRDIHERLLGEAGPGVFPAIEDDNLIIEADVAAQVHEAIASLPAQTGRVAILSLQGFTVEEIASKLSVSPNTVKSLKKAAYSALRGKLGHLRGSWMLFFLFLDK